MKSYTIPQFLAVMEVRDITRDITITNSLKTIATFFNYIMHPTKILLLLWNWTFQLSYFICLLIALFGFFMVVSGNKDYKKYIGGGIISYFFMNILNMFIGGI